MADGRHIGKPLNRDISARLILTKFGTMTHICPLQPADRIQDVLVQEAHPCQRSHATNKCLRLCEPKRCTADVNDQFCHVAAAFALAYDFPHDFAS